MQAAKYDVIVVGGGPAGAGLATHLANAGREVLLLDRAQFPRDKPCGEFFSPPVRGLLSELGVYDEVLAAGVQTVPGAEIVCANGKSFRGQFVSDRSPWAEHGGFSLPRLVLDNLLWQNAARAGVDTREQTAVRRVVRERGRIVGVQTDSGRFEAPLVVGADGSRSRIAREMGVVRPLPALQKIALVGHWAGVDLPENNPVEMHLAASGAVCGFGPGPNGTADVTLVVAQTEAKAIAAAGPEAYYLALLAQFSEAAPRLQNARLQRVAACGTFGHTTKTPVADGALLVGDAAAFIDPFTGEGVYFALRGAQMAAEAILPALRSGNTSARALRGYARARRAELSPKYAVCGLVQKAVHYPGLMAWAAEKFTRRPRLTDHLLGVTGDMEPPQRLLSPRFLAAFFSA